MDMQHSGADNITLTVAFVTGLLGGFGHCTGMCGPLITTLSLTHAIMDVRQRLWAHLLYNAGRITTYVFIAAALSIGMSVITSHKEPWVIQRVAGIIAGIFMILAGVSILLRKDWLSYLETHHQVILRLGRAVSEERSYWRFFLLGGVFGLLPCGMSYAFIAGAAASGDIVTGMAIILSFGMGTIPAMLLIGLATSLIGIRLRGILFRVAGLGVIVMGMLFLRRVIL